MSCWVAVKEKLGQKGTRRGELIRPAPTRRRVAISTLLKEEHRVGLEQWILSQRGGLCGAMVSLGALDELVESVARWAGSCSKQGSPAAPPEPQVLPWSLHALLCPMNSHCLLLLVPTCANSNSILYDQSVEEGLKAACVAAQDVGKEEVSSSEEDSAGAATPGRRNPPMRASHLEFFLCAVENGPLSSSSYTRRAPPVAVRFPASHPGKSREARSSCSSVTESFRILSR